MENRGDKVDIVQGVSCWMSDMAFARFQSFCDHVLGIRIDEIPARRASLCGRTSPLCFTQPFCSY